MAQQLLIWVQNNIGITLFAGMTLIQVTPIKVNPWSWLLKIIGRMLTGELRAEIARYRIIRFADEIQHNDIPHTEEHYGQIMQDITFYEQYCKDNPSFPNNQAIMSISIIKERYVLHLKENSFLK